MIVLQRGSNILTLPNPQYPNTNIVDIKTQFSHDMTGAIHSTKYTPAKESYVLPIRGISKAKKDEALVFLDTVAGLLTQFIDDEGNTHYGYIKVENIAFTPRKLNLYDVDIVFEEI